jgi:hypothetical protein
MADGVSLAIGTAVLKQIYSDGVNEQINNETPALGHIKSTSKNITNVGGAGVAFVAHFGRNHGIGARNELERLPNAGQQVYARGTTGLKSLYGAIQATGHVMNQAKSNPQSFIDYVGEEMSRLKTDLAKDQNRQVYGDGTGTLAKVVTADTTSTVIEVDDVLYLGIGARIDILSATTLVNAVPTPRNTAYVTVTNIDEEDNTITVSAEIGVLAVGDVIVRSSRTASEGTNSWNKEWNGFAKIISDSGSLYGIDPSQYPDWKSHVATPVDSAGALTELDLDSVIQNVRRKGSKPTRIITTPGVYRAYWAALQGLRQYVNKTDLNGGVGGGLTFTTPYGDIPMMTDFDAPKGVAWFPNDKEIALNTNVGWEWIDEQGATWQKIPGYDGFIAEMRNYSELTTYRRNAHGKLEGIKEV